MGTWDSGPFDNDTAADWCGDLDDADAAKRPGLVSEALSRAAGEDGYLDADIACEAIPAAAIVAAQQSGGQPITSPYAPDFLRDGGRLELPSDSTALAVRALDRIMADDSEWHDLWQDAAAGNVTIDAGFQRIVLGLPTTPPMSPSVSLMSATTAACESSRSGNPRTASSQPLQSDEGRLMRSAGTFCLGPVLPIM